MHRDVAADLVRSPRGLVALSGLCREDLDVWPRRFSGPSTVPTALPFDDRVPALASDAPLDDVERLAVDVLFRGSGYAWWGERRLDLDAVVQRGPTFLDAAGELLAAPGARWWGDDVARNEQVMLGGPDAPPDIEARARDQALMSAGLPGRVPQALTTSRPLGQRLPAVGLCDLDAPRPVEGLVGCWHVDIPRDARVYEVHGPDDWRELLARYPRFIATTDDLAGWGVTTPQAVTADWDALARDWDGLHISVLGVLTAVSVPVGVDGLEGVLADVDTDITAWFRPLSGAPRLRATIPEERFPDHLPWP